MVFIIMFITKKVGRGVRLIVKGPLIHINFFVYSGNITFTFSVK